MKSKFIFLFMLLLCGSTYSWGQQKYSGKFATGAETQSKWYKIASFVPASNCNHLSAQVKVDFLYVNTARRYKVEALIRIRKNSANDWQFSLNGFPTGQVKLKDMGNGLLELYAFNLNSYGHFLTEITTVEECNLSVQVFNTPIEADISQLPDVPLNGIDHTSSNRLGINTFNPLTSIHITDSDNAIIRVQRQNSFSEIGQNSSGGFVNLYNANSQSNTLLRSYGDTYFNALVGNVGIGTTSPDAKLTVKGTIHAQEVKVDLNGAVAPDYVFEPDYPLNSLHELAAYIKENKHLPEVPSAKEMETDGVNLLEMNLLLLKKVEELTLYMIQENREKGKLKLQLEEAINKINQIETKIN